MDSTGYLSIYAMLDVTVLCIHTCSHLRCHYPRGTYIHKVLQAIYTYVYEAQ